MDKNITDLVQGEFLKISKISPCGTLEARRLTLDTAFYWRVTVASKTERFHIGIWDSKAPPKQLTHTPRGYSVAAARNKAEHMAQAHKQYLAIGGYGGWLRQQQRDKDAAAQHAIDEAQRVQRELAMAKRYTLASLMQLYVDHQVSLRKQSAGDVASILKNHIIGAWPGVAAQPANAVTAEQIADMQRLLLEKGHGRQANKLRSYVRAAYQMALTARSSASVPLAFKAFEIEHNPAADTVPDAASNKADKNPLSLDEMRAYWHAIKDIKGIKGAALRLHFLTGGQRIAQFVRLRTADCDDDGIVLFDGKGKPTPQPRLHHLPLIPLAAQALQDCKPAGTFALSTDGGKTHIAPTTLSNWAEAIARLLIPDFNLKRVRSGVETALAGADVSDGVRGRLQSHGLSGVQNRHYDGHDYLDKKRQALELLYALVSA